MKTKQAKATYETPRIRKVNLVGDELAVTGCKRNMVSANVQPRRHPHQLGSGQLARAGLGKPG